MEPTIAPSLQTLARAALAILARDAERSGDAWRVTRKGPDGVPIEISCTGPDLPRDVPEEVATPGLIAAGRPWAGACRLTVTAPLIVFDLSWTPGEPMRVMGFSRGDWERDLLALAE